MIACQLRHADSPVKVPIGEALPYLFWDLPFVCAHVIPAVDCAEERLCGETDLITGGSRHDRPSQEGRSIEGKARLRAGRNQSHGTPVSGVHGDEDGLGLHPVRRGDHHRQGVRSEIERREAARGLHERALSADELCCELFADVAVPQPLASDYACPGSGNHRLAENIIALRYDSSVARAHQSNVFDLQ